MGKIHQQHPSQADLKARMESHARKLCNNSLLQIYSGHKSRALDLRWHFGAISIDLSFQRINHETLETLTLFAQEKRLDHAIGQLFNRQYSIAADSPQEHWALREPARPVTTGSESNPVTAQTEKMAALAQALHDGQWPGATGQKITDVVVLATGGPSSVAKLTTQSLSTCPGAIKVHFISSLDGVELAYLLQELSAESTLFILSSRSFRTPDTLSNAHMALRWLNNHLPDHQDILKSHFIGISANVEGMSNFGIPMTNQLQVWSWASGRFSSCSAFSFPLMLTAGASAFQQLLKGAHEMDEHFKKTPIQQNLPVILGLNDVWSRNFLEIDNRVLLPYDGRLVSLVPFASQLEMESCGKQSENTDQPQTAGIIWGQSGLDARHSIHEFLHNGTQTSGCEFIMTRQPPQTPDAELNKQLEKKHTMCRELCLSTAHSFAFESSSSVPQRSMAGIPSTIIEVEDLTPSSLGALIALWEHRVFVQSVLWELNPFDQKGIDKDKQNSRAIYRKYNSDG